MPTGIAIVAALDREVASLIKSWRVCEKTHSGMRFRFFENENDEVVAVCGGIGPVAARRAAEAAIALYGPRLIYSAGFAGAVDSNLKVGDVLVPRRIIDVGDGSSIDTGMGKGVLVSFASVASPEQKAKLRDSFQAEAVDMEAAAVAKAAGARAVRFVAVKAISEESHFDLPPLDRFVSADGRFCAAKFALFAIIRPWMWARVLRLKRNSDVAARALCKRLREIATEADLGPQPMAKHEGVLSVR